MWLVDISPPTRDWTKARLKVPYPNPWATREFPDPVLLFSPKLSQPCPVYFLCLHALPSSIHSANNFFKKRWNILLKQNVGDRSTIIKVQLLWLKVCFVRVCVWWGWSRLYILTYPSFPRHLPWTPKCPQNTHDHPCSSISQPRSVMKHMVNNLVIVKVPKFVINLV